MPDDKLAVFLSSDQEEFVLERRNLSAIMSEMPYFSCVLLENQGAAPRDVVEQSLRKVRASDIYVGVLGREYSETTVKEYKEAVKRRKPCFIYVKRVIRDPRLEKFKEEEVKTRFKFFEFERDVELYRQVKNDLQDFVLDTLRDGLEARATQKDKVERLIVAETRAPARVKSIDLLDQAEIDLQRGLILESLVKTSMAVEFTLSKELEKRNIRVEKKPVTWMLMAARNLSLLTSDQVSKLQEVQYIRNAAVHRGDIPDKQTMIIALNNVRSALESFCNQ
jgi:hypothetical protein